MLSYKIYFIEYLKIIKCVLTVFKNTLPLWQVLTLPGSRSGSQGGAQTSDICLHSHTQKAAQVICQESRSRWELQDAAITQVNNSKQEATPQPTATQKKPNETSYMGTRPATWGPLFPSGVSLHCSPIHPTVSSAQMTSFTSASDYASVISGTLRIRGSMKMTREGSREPFIWLLFSIIYLVEANVYMNRYNIMRLLSVPVQSNDTG